MKAIYRSFLQMLLFVQRDMMLFASCAAPLLAGLAFKFLIPLLEKRLTKWLGIDAILAPYYGLMDLFFSVLAPTMFCFAAAMVILEEHDDHIESYLFVTGLGKTGYLISHIALPGGIAFVVTLVLLPFFKLTALSGMEILLLSFAGTLQGIIIALLIVTLSTNKLEGMAVTKVSSLLILGAFVPYFVVHPVQYVAAVLPSFWMAKALCEKNIFYMVMAVLTSGIWIWSLMRKYKSGYKGHLHR